jgi:hypothetical protein
MIALTNPKTMTNFGEYQLYYLPSEWGEGSMDPSITMKVSAEANLSQMLQFFESFLRAAGYQIDGQSLVLQEDEPVVQFNADRSTGDQSFWEDDGFSMIGNPWMATVGSGLRGGQFGEDVVSFGPLFG